MKIGTSENNTLSNIHLKKIMKSYRFKSTEYKIISGKKDKILDMFINNEIDAVYYTLIHPNPLINLYEKNYRIKLIGTGDIDKNLLELYVPYYITQPIDTRYYIQGNAKHISSKQIFSYGVRNIIISNNHVSNEFIFKFLYTFINNMSILKQKYTFLKPLSRSLITYTRIMVPIHPGSMIYLKEYNYITDNNNPECKFFYGKTKCTNKLLENNTGQLMIDESNLDNTKKINKYNIQFGNEAYMMSEKLKN